MRKLNESSIRSRYPDDPDMIPDAPLRFRTSNPCSSYQLAKSLQCFLYQCDENDVPDRALFKALETFLNQVFESIVTDSPQYEAAKWE